jgi:glycosyltransferase involved in cell wall biosynthesis
MNIVFFAHPKFLEQQSMDRVASMFSDGMRKRGHNTQIWVPQPNFFSLPAPKKLKKWLGYVDQYVVFPNEIRTRLKLCPPDTLFAFVDQALGPYVSLVANRPHVIHCNDFLAIRSAFGFIPENPTRVTGRVYQRFIYRGLLKGRNFISISKKTNQDLNTLLPRPPFFSEVEYLGLNQSFLPQDVSAARTYLTERLKIDATSGYILHVGGNQWYKNRVGVIHLYNALREQKEVKLPLLMLGQQPNPELVKAQQTSPFKNDIHLLSGIEDDLLRTAYSGASIFLFPSIAEGFGWPIAEAMAAGCPVITTNEAPMTEVAGDAAYFIARIPNDEAKIGEWAAEAAKVIIQVLELSPLQRKELIEKGLINSKRFDTEVALDRIEGLYKEIIQKEDIRQSERLIIHK